MASDVMKCLARGTLSTATLTTVYTVPVGKRATIRTIDIANIHTASVSLGATFADVTAATGWAVPAAPDGTSFDGTEVLEAGETIKLIAGVASKLSYHINGVETTL